MRIPAFFISTNDPTIKFRRPVRTTLIAKRSQFKVFAFTTVSTERITSIKVRHDVSNKELSAGKALAGGLLAGGFGVAVGAAMGGKNVSSILTIEYLNSNGDACEMVFDAKLGYLIKEQYDKHTQVGRINGQAATTPANKALRRGLLIYYTWPYQLYKKLQNRQSKND